MHSEKIVEFNDGRISGVWRGVRMSLADYIKGEHDEFRMMLEQLVVTERGGGRPERGHVPHSRGFQISPYNFSFRSSRIFLE